MLTTLFRRLVSHAGTSIPFEPLEERRLLAAYDEITRVPLAQNPERLAVADFNADGRSDVATLNDEGYIELSLSSTIAGTYRRASSLPTTEFLTDLDALDWNADGRADLVATSYSQRALHVYTSNPDGSFGAATVIAIAGTPASSRFRYSAFADFNNDGQIDVAIADRSADRLEVALRTSATAFGPVTAIIVGDEPTDVVWGDFDGDGDRDLVVANTLSESVTILRNNGAGGFGNAITRNTAGVRPVRVASGDLNGDGFADIVTANSGSPGTVSVFKSVVAGPGTLDFETLQEQPVTNATGVTLGDIDLDGDLDIAVSSQTRTAILRNNGNFIIGSREDYGFDSKDVALGNADNEPGLDLFAVDYFDRTAIVGFNYGNGILAGPIIVAPLQATLTPETIARGDIDGDGDPDIIVLNPSSSGSTVSALRNLGGFLSVPANYSLGSGGNTIQAIALGDVNNDGFADLVGLDNTGDDLVVRRGSASGVLGPQSVALNLANGGFYSTSFFALGDLNGDGLADAVFRSAFDRFSVTLNTGSGTFGPPVSYQADIAFDDIQLADIDGDGGRDVVLAGDFEFSIHLSTGTGALNPAGVSVAAPSNVSRMQLADFSGDARPDLAFTASNTANIFLNQSTPGSVIFTNHLEAPTGLSNARSLSAADIDADGDTDLVIHYEFNNVIRVIRNDGASITLSQEFPLLSSGTSILANLDSGGSPDLITLNRSAKTLDVAFNAGNGRFVGPVTRIPGATSPVRAFSQDIDGDGFVDLLTVSNSNFPDSVFISRGSAAGFDAAASRAAATTVVVDAALADFNGDGRTDLLLLDGDNTERRLVLHPGTGNNSTFFGAPQTVFTASESPVTAFTAMAVGNIDAVAGLDVVLLQTASNRIWSIRNSGTGTFSFSGVTDTADFPRALVLADFDGNGNLDAAVANYSSGSVTVHPNNGTGTGQIFQGINPGATFATGLSGPWSIAAADLSGDGRPEIVVGFDQFNAPIQILTNTRSEGDSISFSLQPIIQTGVSDTRPRIRLRDINGDGRTDILAGTQAALSVLENAGPAGFPSIALFPLPASDFDTYQANSDAVAEIAGVNSSTSAVTLLQSLPRSAVALAATAVGENFTTLTATVRFANSRLIDVASIGTGDVKMYSTATGYFATGTLVGTPAVQADNSVVAAFTFPAPRETNTDGTVQFQGYWDASDNGGYFLELSANAVRRNNQQFFPAQLLQTYGLFFNSPTVDLLTTSVAAGGAFLDATVRYTDHAGANRGISWGSVGDGDLQLIGPDGEPVSAVLLNRLPPIPGTGQLTAVYRFAARGGTWDSTDNGEYFLRMVPRAVLETTGFEVAPRISDAESAPHTLRPYNLFFNNPTAARESEALIDGGTFMDITVRYTDAAGAPRGISFASLDNNDLELVGPNGYAALGTLFAASVPAPFERLVTYRFTAPGGAWDLSDNGSYTVRTRFNQVNDEQGFAVPVMNLRTYPLFFNSPSATVAATDVANGRTDLLVAVTYRPAPNTFMDWDSMGDGDDLSLTGPNGYNALSSLVSRVYNSSNNTYTVTYRFLAPGGTWNAADNGDYTLSVRPNEVFDALGRAVPASIIANYRLFF